MWSPPPFIIHFRYIFAKLFKVYQFEERLYLQRLSMQSQQSEAFLSFDSGHYNNSESLILKQCYQQPNAFVDKSLSNIRISQNDIDQPQGTNSSLNQELNRISFNENKVSEQQMDQMKVAIKNLMGFQQCLKQKMGIATELIRAGNQKQVELTELVLKLKDNLEVPCQVQQHGKYEIQLAKNKQLIEQSEQQLQTLLQNLKYQNNDSEKKIIEQSRSQQIERKTQNYNRPFTDDDTIVQKSTFPINNDKDHLLHIDQDQKYLSMPFILLFKKSIIQKFLILYEDDDVRINYEVLAKGLKIKLHSDDQNTQFQIRGSKGRSILLSWQQFVYPKKSFEECKVFKEDKSIFQIQIPLPLNLVIQKRLNNQINIPILKIKQLMSCSSIVISHFDKDMWQFLLKNPLSIHFSRSGDREMLGMFNIVGNSSMYLVQICEMNNKRGELKVQIYYKSRVYLKQIQQFLKYALCS